jgi:hypothetical protein
MPDTLAPLGLEVDVVTGTTVAMVPVVVGAGAVVVAAVGAVVGAAVFEVVSTAAEPPHPAIPNAAATDSRENARKRDTRLPFEVPAQHDWLAAD